MKRHYCTASDSLDQNKNKMYKVHIDNKEISSVTSGKDNTELTIRLPKMSDLDYIEENGLIMTKTIDEEAVSAVEQAGSYLDEDDKIHIPLILLCNGKIACYLQLVISPATKEATIDWLGTTPPLRGKGFAKLFLLTILNLLEKYGIEQIDLTSSEEGMSLYLKCGFLPIDEKLLIFLKQGQSLLQSIPQVLNYVHAHEDGTINTVMSLDFTEVYCQQILQNYLAENRTMLAKINNDPEVEMLLKVACAIDNSVSSQEEQENDPIHFSSYKHTFFNMEKNSGAALQFDLAHYVNQGPMQPATELTDTVAKQLQF